MVGLVYGLVDPRYECIRYVGKTSKTLAERLNGHLKASRASVVRYPVHQWIKKLNSLDKPAYAVVLEQCDDVGQELSDAEVMWIAYLGRDALLNMTDGGTGGATSFWHKKSLEQISNHKSKISLGLKNYWNSLSPEERAVRYTDKMKEKISSAHKSRYSDPAQRLATSKAVKASMTTEVKEKMRASAYKAHGNDPFDWNRNCVVCGLIFTSKRRATMSCKKCRHTYSWMKRRENGTNNE